jgi:hypothetical protein
VENIVVEDALAPVGVIFASDQLRFIDFQLLFALALLLLLDFGILEDALRVFPMHELLLHFGRVFGKAQGHIWIFHFKRKGNFRDLLAGQVGNLSDLINDFTRHLT